VRTLETVTPQAMVRPSIIWPLALFVVTTIPGGCGFDVCAGRLLLCSGSSRPDRLSLYPKGTKIVVGVDQRSHLDYSWRHDLETLAIQFVMGSRTTRRNWNADDRCHTVDDGSCNAQARRRDAQYAGPKSTSCIVMTKQKGAFI
jgi:hypothetical protein